MIISGGEWVSEPGESSGEAQRQLRLRLKHLCLLGKSFFEVGFTVVLDDIILGDRWQHLLEDLHGLPFSLIVLAPCVDAVQHRDLNRPKKTQGSRRGVPGQCPLIMNFLKTLPAKAREVLHVPSTLPTFLVSGGRVALVLVRSDFWTDGLWHGEYPCFGASTATRLPVVAVAHVQPAGASPHLPRVLRTGYMREDHLFHQDRPQDTRNTDPAARDLCPTRPHAQVCQRCDNGFFTQVPQP
jgi:hypothetical protein